MSTNFETGHAKNVALFETLISFCNGHGADYQPSNGLISLGQMGARLDAAKNILQECKSTKTFFDNAINARQEAFKDLKPLATKVINALAACGASQLTVSDAKAVNRKIQGARAASGTRATTSPTADVPADKTISVSQQSYDNMVDYFARLIEVVSQEPRYTPNETALKADSLKTKLETMQQANSAIATAYTGWSNARIRRNQVLYHPLTGLVHISLGVKQYVKSVFGATSSQYKQISGLPIRFSPTP